MSTSYGENSPPKATSDAYRNSSFWDKVEADKKKESKEAKDQLKQWGIGL